MDSVYTFYVHLFLWPCAGARFFDWPALSADNTYISLLHSANMFPFICTTVFL
jgi:hypothetical protein